MRKFGYIVLGLALLVGALSVAGYRHLLPQSASFSKSAPVGANRSVSAPPAASPRGSKTDNQSLSGVQIFEMGLNVANVVVGLLGIWMTMRGFRAERRAEQAMAMRSDR